MTKKRREKREKRRRQASDRVPVPSRRGRRSPVPYVVGAAAALAVVAVVALILVSQLGGDEASAPESPPIWGPSRILGNPDAPVKIVEYADFQCPYCKLVEGKVAQLVQDYVQTGKASLEFRNFAFLGDESVLAAEASLCAEDQGKYGAYHAALFSIQGRENSGVYNTDKLQDLAKEVGLDTATFKDCLTNHRHRQEVLDERQLGRQAGVTSTPYFLVNQTPILGDRPYGDFKKVIDAELQRTSGGGS